MVEAESNDKAREQAQQAAQGQALPAETPLEHKYHVWAMVKQTRQQQQQYQQDLSEAYITDNKVVASFGTVGEFWHV